MVRAYRKGTPWFGIDELSRAAGDPINERAGVLHLATLGFAMHHIDGDRVELRAADPRAARFVNEARLGQQTRGFGVRRVIEAFLLVRPPERSRVNITDDRRLLTADVLAKRWFIECDDLLSGRKRVRLVSTWTFDHPEGPPAHAPAAVAVGG